MSDAYYIKKSHQAGIDEDACKEALQRVDLRTAGSMGRAGLKEQIERLQADNARLWAALERARDALHNDFEPDNQSKAYKDADAALKRRGLE